MSLNSQDKVDLYAPTYGRFNETLHSEVRRDTWGEEFGQSGWTTAAEQDRFIELLGLKSEHTLLDVGCGLWVGWTDSTNRGAYRCDRAWHRHAS